MPPIGGITCAIIMTENNNASKRVHPFRMAEELAQNPIKSLDVQPMEVNPFMVAQFPKNAGKTHPFLTAQWAREEN